MTSLDLERIAGGFRPVMIDVSGVSVPDCVDVRAIVNGAYKLYLQQNPDFVAECHSMGTDIAKSIDDMFAWERQRWLDAVVTHIKILVLRGYVLTTGDDGMDDAVVKQIIYDLAKCLHGNWAARIQAGGAIFGPMRIIENGSVRMHPDLLPFELLSFFDPNSTELTGERLKEREQEQAEAQARFVNEAERTVRALIQNGIVIRRTEEGAV